MLTGLPLLPQTALARIVLVIGVEFPVEDVVALLSLVDVAVAVAQ
jgi:hypothetical protein